MSPSLQQFRQNVESLRSLSLIYDYMDTHRVGEVMELTELLRAQHVLLVSAFDFYIHDVVRSGMLESLEGKREESKHFQQLRRRNQIAHEADYDPIRATKRDLSKEDMASTLAFVTAVVEAVDRLVFG